MSSFFRDNKHGFKPRNNIFSKIRNSATENDFSVTESLENLSNTSKEHATSNVFANNSKTSFMSGATTLASVQENSLESLFEEYQRDDTTNGASNNSSIIMPKIKDYHDKRSPLLNNKNVYQPKGGNRKLHIEDQENNDSNNNILFSSKEDSPEDNDDIEITDIKQISKNTPSNTKERSDYESSSDTDDKKFTDGEHVREESSRLDIMINESSNDVLMKAFTNTQKICSQLKMELQKSKDKNNTLKNEVATYKTEINNLTKKFEGFQNGLNSMAENQRELTKIRESNDMKLKNIGQEMSEVKRKMDNSNIELNSLRTILTNVKELKKNLEIDLIKKNKEIDYLKKEINNAYGQLSEEKIKSNGLLKDVNELKTLVTDSNTSMLEKLKDHLGKAFNLDKIQLKITNKIDAVDNNLAGVQDLIVNKIDVSIDEYTTKSLDSIKQLVAKNDESNGALVKTLEFSVKNFLDNNSEDIVSKTSKLMEDLLANLENSAFLKKIESCTSEILTTVKLVTPNNNTNYEKLLGQIQKMQILLQNEGENVNEISALKDNLVLLNMDKTNLVTEAKNKDLEIQSLNEKYNLKDDQLKQLSEKLEILQKQIESCSVEKANMETSLNFKIEQYQDDIKNLTMNLEDKTEKLSKLSDGNNELENKVNDLEAINIQFKEKVKQYEDLNTKTNEKIQKLNVEIVQLKAKEMELEESIRLSHEKAEENYKDKNYEIERCQLVQNENSKYKSENSSLLNSKIELQQKVYSLENEINRLKKNSLGKTIKHNNDKGSKDKSKKLEEHKSDDEIWQVDRNNKYNKNVIEPNIDNKYNLTTMGNKTSIIGNSPDDFDLPITSNNYEDIGNDLELTDPPNSFNDQIKNLLISSSSAASYTLHDTSKTRYEKGTQSNTNNDQEDLKVHGNTRKRKKLLLSPSSKAENKPKRRGKKTSSSKGSMSLK
ncbi:uncharacterized protein SCODWIG_01911 [Saccharomycodes ludwigii]|uniref:Synaptonemal complex protein ZIP1 n=1 Tax=Saccharomycodes ludwigii TaxID=36035 RepID=A0A376B7Q2_9ASCO|nr:uncharacterized protein SCODWIG_01911 [Saccharomycodes ludwigii]